MSETTPRLRRLDPDAVAATRRVPFDAQTHAQAARIVADVREQGEAALRAHAERLGDLEPGAPLVRSPAEMTRALEALASEQRALLERTAARIRRFAEAQRAATRELEIALPGGRAGHRMLPVERAGCYAPGGRYPLPSSVLMTGIPARVAGVREIWLASPRPGALVLAAGAIIGAAGVLAVGGAQAIAALAYGAGAIPPCDVVCGPGNRWVTAAKQCVFGQVAIDMLAGPSELVVIADEHADPERVAADLLAQAEHDPHALALLLTPSPALADRVDRAIEAQLATLPTRAIAAAAIANGGAVCCRDLEQALALADRLAPEHVQLHTREPERHARALRHYGALFVGAEAAEVLGDYGAGPNHTLPTGGSARAFAGLSVSTFLRARTWLRIDDPLAAAPLARDAAEFARLEGLYAHRRAARMRLATAEGAEVSERAAAAQTETMSEES